MKGIILGAIVHSCMCNKSLLASVCFVPFRFAEYFKPQFFSYFFFRAIGNGLKTIQTDQHLSTIYRSTIGQLSTDISKGYPLTIVQVSTDHRPTVNQLLTDTSVKYQPTIGEVSVKCRLSRWSVGEVSVNWMLYRPTDISTDISTDYLPTVDLLLTDCRPTIDRLSTDCRPTIDRVSTAISVDISGDTSFCKHDPKKIIFAILVEWKRFYIFFQAEEQFYQFIWTTFTSLEQCFTLCIHLTNIDQECVTRD